MQPSKKFSFLLLLFLQLAFIYGAEASVEYRPATIEKVREPLHQSTQNIQLTKKEKRQAKRAEKRSQKYKLKQSKKKHSKSGLSNNNRTLGWIFSAIGVVFLIPAILIFAFQLGAVSYLGVIFIGLAILAIIIAAIFIILGIVNFAKS